MPSEALRRMSRRLPAALSTGLGLAPEDAELAGAIRAAQIAGIVRLTPLVMVASSLNALILLATLDRVGALGPALVVWAACVVALTGYYLRGWARRRRRDPARPASVRAIRAAVFHGALFGAAWGVVPVIAFPGAPMPMQLLIGCLTAGMMCAGGFVLATVPLAGWAYVAAMAAGSTYALLAEGTAICVGLMALMLVYAAVVVVNLTWNAQLFVDHLLAQARLRRETAARERAQAHLAHAQRMTALGELAGGVAHDFNNVLQAIVGAAALMAEAREDPAQVARLCEVILNVAARGGAISRRMLAFARQDRLSAEEVDVAALLGSATELFGHALGPLVTLRVETAPGLPHVSADRAQLEAVLVNLVGNARDAMPGGGELTLAAAVEAVAAGGDRAPARAGRYVVISVADTGAGMDAATLARVTEPFFTTKPKGKGTGLGLAMARGFAEQSGGALAIDSAPGRGAVVRLWLPEHVAVAPPPEVPARPPPEPAARRHVMVVDDDDLVREVTMLSLSEAGFAISGAEHGAAALEQIDRGAVLDALVTDYAMPMMDGIALIRAVRARRPGTPAILLTGHVADPGAWNGDAAGEGQVVMLQKPVRPSELADRLSAVLA